MRSVAAVVFLIALAPGARAADEKYVSKAGNFKIVFPAKPTETVEKSGATKVSVEAKGKLHEILFFDLPENTKDVPSKTFFDGGEKAALKEANKKLVSSTDFTFGPNKLAAREVIIQEGEKMHRALMIRDGLRFYVLAVGGPNTFTTAKEAYAFFESFEITK